MEIQTRVTPSESWLRDDLEEVYALLFRFLGYGFRLAMSKLRAVAGAARPQAKLVTSVNTHLPSHSLRAFCHTKEERRHGRWHSHGSTVATTATVVTPTATVTLCFPSLSQVHRRQKQLSDFVETRKYWTLLCRRSWRRSLR